MRLGLRIVVDLLVARVEVVSEAVGLVAAALEGAAADLVAVAPVEVGSDPVE